MQTPCQRSRSAPIGGVIPCDSSTYRTPSGAFPVAGLRLCHICRAILAGGRKDAGPATQTMDGAVNRRHAGMRIDTQGIGVSLGTPCDGLCWEKENPRRARQNDRTHGLRRRCDGASHRPPPPRLHAEPGQLADQHIELVRPIIIGRVQYGRLRCLCHRRPKHLPLRAPPPARRPRGSASSRKASGWRWRSGTTREEQAAPAPQKPDEQTPRNKTP